MRLKPVVTENFKNTLVCGFFSAIFLVYGCGGAKPQAGTPSEPELDGPKTAAPARATPRASPLVLEAETLLSNGDAAGAKAKLEDALRGNDRDARAYLALGLAEETLGDMAAAEKAYRGAIASDDSLAEAHNNLGLVLRDANKNDEAISELERATQLDPKLASAHANLAMAFEDAGKPTEARMSYEHAAKLTPNDAMLRANQGLFLLQTGDKEAALTALRAGLANAGNDRATLLAIGNGLRRAGNADEAVRALRAAVAGGDGKPTPALLSELALAQVAADDAKAASQSLEQALTLDPKYATGHYVLAGVLAEQGDMRGAIAHYKRCLELEPKGPLAEKASEKLKVAQKTKPKR
jgi:Tfp pilus assembly protein PilF